ncbi:MAG TPA: hypothetical protein VFV38_45850 [Ktedonobacteraceae bacterium]|nr:hypothetical protein [Ktedonobacteraceae bacterium]
MQPFYHVTLTENVASLLANGADPAQVGVNSLKAGPGFHLTPRYEWAEEWGRELFYYPSPPGPQTTILQVTLPDTARFAEDRYVPEEGILQRWGKKQGYLERDGSPSSKLLQVAHEENWPEDSDYFLAAMNEGVDCALLGVYLTTQGYDGYWVVNDLVITNFSLLGPGAFARATGMHHQLVTIQDAETGRFLTLKLSPGANGLMVYCYPGEQTSGKPLAWFQAASYNDQLEILYQDAAMSEGQDSKRIVLAEHIPPQHQNTNQPTEDQSK